MRNSFYLKRVSAVLLVLALTCAAPARTRKGDRYLRDGRVAEDAGDYGKALDLFEKAVLEDPTDAAYQLAMRRVRYQAGQALVDTGRKLREQGKLEEALREFQKAFAVDPASSVAEQELRRTMQMIEREKKTPSPEAERGLTPTQAARKAIEERIAAARRLGELPDRRAVMALLETLEDPSPRLRAEAAKSLGRLGYRSMARAALLSRLQDPDPDVRQAAALALGQLHDSWAIPALRHLATTERAAQVRRAAWIALRQIDEAQSPTT